MAPRTLDVVRQVVVAVSAVLAVVSAAVGSGAFGGTPIAEAGGGALSSDATFVAPDGPAFAIWTPIYLGLLALAGWQLAPSRRADPRQRRIGWLVAATMLVNAGWILTVQAGRVGQSVAVIGLLLILLIAAYRVLVDSRPSGWVEAALLDATMGLYLGWVSIATIANVAAALVDSGRDELLLGATAWAVLVLVFATIIGVVVAAAGQGRFAFAVALAWGLAWVAVGRTDGSDDSTGVAVTAVAAAIIVVGATLIARLRDRAMTASPA